MTGRRQEENEIRMSIDQFRLKCLDLVMELCSALNILRFCSSERSSFSCTKMLNVGLRIEETQLSMSLRMRVHWLY